MKLVAHRAKDIDDALQLVRRHPVDFDRVRRVVSQFCEILDDDARMLTIAKLERA